MGQLVKLPRTAKAPSLEDLRTTATKAVAEWWMRAEQLSDRHMRLESAALRARNTLTEYAGLHDPRVIAAVLWYGLHCGPAEQERIARNHPSRSGKPPSTDNMICQSVFPRSDAVSPEVMSSTWGKLGDSLSWCRIMHDETPFTLATLAEYVANGHSLSTMQRELSKHREKTNGTKPKKPKKADKVETPATTATTPTSTTVQAPAPVRAELDDPVADVGMPATTLASIVEAAVATAKRTRTNHSHELALDGMKQGRYVAIIDVGKDGVARIASAPLA
jgi:hypothetical protein